MYVYTYKGFDLGVSLLSIYVRINRHTAKSKKTKAQQIKVKNPELIPRKVGTLYFLM